MKIVDVNEHIEGGHIVTVEFWTAGKWFFGLFGKESKPYTKRFLRNDVVDWFSWPDVRKLSTEMDLSLEDSFGEFKLQKKYSALRERYQESSCAVEAEPSAAPSRCMFCHTEMEGLTAQCQSCGGAMHLACADEVGDKCVTPGCESSRHRTTSEASK